MKHDWLDKKQQIIYGVVLSMGVCTSSFALELGNMKVHSEPGEPFEARVRLLDVPSDLNKIAIQLTVKEITDDDDDDDDDEQLDQGEAPFVTVDALANCEEQHAAPGARLTCKPEGFRQSLTPAACILDATTCRPLTRRAKDSAPISSYLGTPRRPRSPSRSCPARRGRP